MQDSATEWIFDVKKLVNSLQVVSVSWKGVKFY